MALLLPLLSSLALGAAPHCARALGAAPLAAPVHAPKLNPTQALLSRIASSCEEELPALAQAARAVADQPRAARNRLLGEAAARELGSRCAPGRWDAPGAALPAACWRALAAQRALVQQSDAGVVLYASALLGHMGAAAEGTARALVEASALERMAERSR